MGHYDLADQRAFEDGQPVFALPDAVGVVTLTGPDALRLVGALTTLPPGLEPSADGVEALLLDGQGHIVFGLTVARAAEGFTLLTDGSGEALAELLNAKRFRLRAKAESRPDLRVLVTPAPPNDPQSTAQPNAPQSTAQPDNPPSALSAHPALRDNWPLSATSTERAGNGRSGAVYPRYALVPDHPGTAWTGLTSHIYDPAAPSPLPDQLVRGGHRQIDAAMLEGLRIAAWRPLAGREAADGKTLPHELDWLRSTTPMNSGCFPGQETVAKIVNVGKPPRRLVFLHLDGSEATLPPAGSAVHAPAPESAASRLPDGQPTIDPEVARSWPIVGRVTSAAVHHELGPIALALVKRSLPGDIGLAVAAGTASGLIAANQTVIVPPTGESDARPTRRTAAPKLPIRRRR